MRPENFNFYKTLLVVVALAWITGCTAPVKKDPKDEATIDSLGIWKEGVMTEEFLLWDNQAYMNQIGLGK